MFGLSDILTGVNLIQKNRPPTTRERLLAHGSQTWKYEVPAIAASARLSVSIEKEFPRARYYLPLDSFEIINNSGVDLIFWLNPTESYTVPAYMIKPIARRPVSNFILENASSVTGIAVDEIVIHMRRLAPDITPTVNVSG